MAEPTLQHAGEYWMDRAQDWMDRALAAESKLHQLSEDHSHCEGLLHELGERASRAEGRLDSLAKALRKMDAAPSEGQLFQALDEAVKLLEPVVEKHEHKWTRMGQDLQCMCGLTIALPSE